jgi:hypothetical protein
LQTKASAHLTFTDLDGCRYRAFVTGLEGRDIRFMEAL